MRNFRSDVHCSDLQRPLYVDIVEKLADCATAKISFPRA